jgi:hypothetical protein
MTTNLRSEVQFKFGFIGTVTDNTAFVSAIIDTKGFNWAGWSIIAGSLADADATFTALVEDSDAADLSGATAVPDEFLEGTEAAASLTFADDNKIRRIGYRCRKRYVRLTMTPANNSGSASLAAIAHLTGATYLPVSQPSA